MVLLHKQAVRRRISLCAIAQGGLLHPLHSTTPCYSHGCKEMEMVYNKGVAWRSVTYNASANHLEHHTPYNTAAQVRQSSSQPRPHFYCARLPTNIFTSGHHSSITGMFNACHLCGW